MTVVDWLLDADPSIRWQVMRDLTDEPAEVVAAERAKVATEDRPSRWNTLGAMRVLRWWDEGRRSVSSGPRAAAAG